ncbi:MAG: potassium transporter [Rhodospirillaceae bacterium]|nr:potassium transporter [Rhodospirillaceae bacterium]|tara:strand:- start:2275 stop:2928 length:654 start_codon:yes stop_codon:yes gene_type:complete
MRVVLIGGSQEAIATAEILLHQGHDVIMVERDKDKVEQLAQQLDCGFIHGDGSRPAILREVGPKGTDLLLCLTNDDQDNILAALVGRSLGFQRVVTQIHDPEFEHICIELGLQDTIVPHRTIARILADLVNGRDVFEISTMIKGDVRFFSFIAGKDEAGTIADLGLPEKSRAVCIYRGDGFLIPDGDTTVKERDEVVLITHSANLASLQERWGGTQS